jgi:hypothetical protein
MFVRRTVIAAALVAVPLAFAASAQAAPCSYFGDDPNGPDNSVCGAPNINESMQHAKENLQTNFSVDNAIKNLQKNLSGNFG